MAKLGLLSLASVVTLATVAVPARPSAPGVRCIVLENDDVSSATWTSVAGLGANLVARAAPPGPEADRAAGEAGVSYISLLTTAEIEGLRDDETRLLELQSEKHLAGFFYSDVAILEGFTSPDSQRRAYGTLKELFPAKIVLYPMRLDPIVWSPGFLDGYFRPEFTDIVTPYFYPVGTTPIGKAREQDDWQSRLAQLLAELAPRIPAGKPILPVLQGYEQEGFPLGTRFPAAQLDVYRRFWPGLNDAAIEGWEYGPGPLTALVSRPALQEGVCVLFARLAGPSRRCGLRPTATWR